MKNNFLGGLSEKSRYLFEQWKYLLLQEKCRLCHRLIHPLCEGMNFDKYGPPAKYFINKKEILSDVICQFCVANLAQYHPYLNVHKYQIGGINHSLIVASGAVFAEPISILILRFKYGNDVLLAKDFSFLLYGAWQLLQDEFKRAYIQEPTEQLFLVPVPLHTKRLYERGYNQAEILAKQFGYILDMKVEGGLLYRARNTASQQELSKAERAENINGAFKTVYKNAFLGKNIILIDDVFTSGATLRECAKIVLKEGAAAVYALTIAFVP